LELIAVFLYVMAVNQTEKLHLAAIELLTRFDLDYCRLDRQRDEYFRYRAWNTPIPQHNGHPPIIRRGRIKVPA
jgi:hypothetical protein